MKKHSRKKPIHQNCRACGTNPRALEENPRAGHPKYYSLKKIPEWLKSWDKSKNFR